MKNRVHVQGFIEDSIDTVVFIESHNTKGIDNGEVIAVSCRFYLPKINVEKLLHFNVENLYYDYEYHTWYADCVADCFMYQ